MSLISAVDLKELFNDPHLVVLDATWFLPKAERHGKEEFKTQHIAGARFFDYDQEVCDSSSAYPRMMPSVELFEASVRALGVSNTSKVVVYDNNQMFSSPRAWWMFKAMGHTSVFVLDGGLEAWLAVGGEVEAGEPSALKGDFVADPVEQAFVDAEHVLNSIQSGDRQILDARAAERFKAEHMPKASNLHYQELLRDGKMKPLDELKEIYSEKITADKGVTFSCGSGVTACILVLGASLSGYEDLKVYDASWSEWGKREDLPKA